MTSEGDVIVPHAEVVNPLTDVRTTLLGSSMAILKDRGLTDRYYAMLPRQHHAAMRELIIGVWAPVELAVAHYQTLDRLGFTTSEQFELGRTYTLGIQKTFLGTILRLAGSGASPFTALQQLPRIAGRAFQGGSPAAFRCGPKDARIEYRGFPLGKIPYFREGFRGLITGSLELFCRRAFVTAKTFGDDDRIDYRLSWA